MSEVNDSARFAGLFTNNPENDDNSDDDTPQDDDGYLTDDASQFSTISIRSSDERDTSMGYVDRAGEEDDDDAADEGAQVEVAEAIIAQNIPPHAPSENNTNNDPEAAEVPIPKGRSIAHHDIANNKIAYLSIDVEDAGEIAGLVQLSAEIFYVELDVTGIFNTRSIIHINCSGIQKTPNYNKVKNANLYIFFWRQYWKNKKSGWLFLSTT